MNQPTVMIIPAYEPPLSFLPFLRELREMTEAQLVIVDDGSGDAYRERFAEAERIPACTVLTHEKNRGKGCALRTAFAYAEGAFAPDTVYVCADCDGQHTARDMLRVAEEVKHNPDALVLGCRDFSKAQVPLRSSFGNRATALLFRLLFGQHIRDTQTGLRGFSHGHLPLLLSLSGDGFEYEMHTLATFALRHIPLRCISIETKYNTSAQGCERVSHFSAFRDSARILRVLFSYVARYTAVGILSTLVDTVLFYVLLRFVFSGNEEELPLLIATAMARLGASLVNFLLNFKYVFRVGGRGVLWRYYTVWLGRLAASYAVVLLLSVPQPSPSQLTLGKTVFDLLLGLLTLRLLRTWVFAPRGAARSTQSII